MTPALTLFHTPYSRSSGTLALLEELHAEYALHLVNQKKGEQRQPEYLAVNPMGKVPALLHGEALVTEQVAIFIYLADLYPQAKLAPAIGDPLRGPYLRWMAFYGSCFEPAVCDFSLKREPAPQSGCPYGDYQTTLDTLTAQLAKGPYLLGDTFSAADVLWASSLSWIVAFKMVPELPLITAYIERVNQRPAMQKAAAKDAKLYAAQAPA
ncbi:glutathione S-transferase family protein [Rugamonas rubra]|uniref:Glutathione S-transferase n=1 Tax=Rugamonas rubra TaxID=758825 RepID=A0A1I4KGL8_9BURK|nr:glutathione S-transferase family protein [Rugamonas rubra]SFL77910.1 glutathione S-transferase [Rugamonas rubra]